MKIGVTIGDVSGIGPEVVAKAANKWDKSKLLIIGSKKIMDKITDKLNIKLREDKIEFRDLNNINIEDIKVGQACAISGKAAVEYIKEAVDLFYKKQVDAIVTAPISKEAINCAGYHYVGHTDLLASLTATTKYAMMFVGDNLRITLLTTHVALKKVSSLISKNRIKDVIKLTSQALIKYFNIKEPKIAVASFNPHAGEGGLLGKEEINKIIPAIEALKLNNVYVYGPYAADSLFYRAYCGEFDAVIAIYHDQALIPIKLLYFNKAVNMTIGLPFIRTSPCHGTAFDIADKYIADASSMYEAINLAYKLTTRCSQ